MEEKTGKTYDEMSEMLRDTVVADWYEHIKQALDILRKQKDSREKAVLITMLEQVLAYAWLWVVRK